MGVLSDVRCIVCQDDGCEFCPIVTYPEVPMTELHPGVKIVHAYTNEPLGTILSTHDDGVEGYVVTALGTFCCGFVNVAPTQEVPDAPR